MQQHQMESEGRTPKIAVESHRETPCPRMVTEKKISTKLKKWVNKTILHVIPKEHHVEKLRSTLEVKWRPHVDVKIVDN